MAKSTYGCVPMSSERGRGRDSMNACRKRCRLGRSRVCLALVRGQIRHRGLPEWSASLSLLLRPLFRLLCFSVSPLRPLILELLCLVPMVWDEMTGLRTSSGTSLLVQVTPAMVSYGGGIDSSFLLPTLSARFWRQPYVVTHLHIGGVLYRLWARLFSRWRRVKPPSEFSYPCAHSRVGSNGACCVAYAWP